MSYTVLLCGVGGQGTILAAHILADVAMRCGLDVKVSEIHGMAQRGGEVTTVVSFGEEVMSMVCGKGCADMIISFEMLEALRNCDQLKQGGTMIVSDEIIKPASVLTGRMELPHDMQGMLFDMGALLVPAEATAREAGNIKASNVVLLGAASAVLDLSTEAWESAIADHVPPKTKDVNLKAFNAGRSFVQEHKGVAI